MRGDSKTYKLKNSYPNVKFITSTTNRHTKKTYTCEVRFWYSQSENKNPQVELNDLFRRTKKTILDAGKPYFSEEKFIGIKDIPIHLDIAVSNIFTMFEFTLFPKVKFANDIHVSQVLHQITENVFRSVYEGRDDISVSKRK